MIQMVDVIINVYGKPYQTLCALKSLLQHSGSHIDKIYFIAEKEGLFNDDVLWITEFFENIEIYVPGVNHYFETTKDYYTHEGRYNIKYQYGIEKSDKKYVFITHNDMFYTGDILGDMLAQIGSCAGIGMIGMCWNCPANKDGCDGYWMEKYSPTYEKILELIDLYHPPRTFAHNVDKICPMPLPECRLNEFACLIDREITMSECWPNGNTPPFGSYDLDFGCEWFRSLFLKGYKFRNYDIFKTSDHGYFSGITAGLVVQKNIELYKKGEESAKLHFNRYYYGKDSRMDENLSS